MRTIRFRDAKKEFDSSPDTGPDPFPWLQDIFQEHLTPINPNSIVCCFGVGPALELYAIRSRFGFSAQLHAFDIADRRNERGIMATNATGTDFQLVDIAEMDDIKRLIVGNPDVVICRHPQPGMAQALASWAKFIQDTSGQMLITLISNEQKSIDIHKEEMANAGVNFITSTNNYGQELQTEDGEKFRPDSFVIKINLADLSVSDPGSF